MKNNNKLSFLIGIMAIIFTISAFTPQQDPAEKEKPQNLKVLPKNISEEELTTVMRGFNTALGVKCNHCHAPKTNGQKGLDFASDANPNKNTAREMIKMTKKINKKYFSKEHDGIVKNINCETCHNGASQPKTVAMLK